MANLDLSKITGNIGAKDKLNNHKEINGKKGVNKPNSTENQLTSQSTPLETDVNISEYGLKRLETSKNKDINDNSNPLDLMKQIRESPKDFFKAHSNLSPGKVSDLLKD